MLKHNVNIAWRHIKTFLTMLPLLLISTSFTHAGLPLYDSQGKALPSLAPLLEKVNAAVVNISVSQTNNKQNNPLLNDPYFRQFFHIPKGSKKTEKTNSMGSGIIADSKKGIVITNHHVIKDANTIMVGLSDGRNIEATLIGSDPDVDIAVLKINAKNLKSIPWVNSDTLRVGDFSIAIGNPFGLGQTVTSGIISALGRSGLGIQGYENFIQTDASINPGNSGGALINLRGELIGINTAIIAPSGGNVGIGFAIPTNMAKYSMEQIIKYGKVSRGQLGIYIQPLTPELAELLHAKKNQTGIVISSVKPQSPADKAGLKEGDIITTIDSKSIKTPFELRNAVGIQPPGKPIKIHILRYGKKKEFLVTIAKNVFVNTDKPLRPTKNLPQNIIEGTILSKKNGQVVVSEVSRNSSAARSGLQKDDVILSLNKQHINSLQQAKKIMQNASKNILVHLKRNQLSLFLILRR
jgi:Do/DeqQ family serine protease